MKQLILILFLAIASIAYTQTSPGVTPQYKPKTVSELTKGCDSTQGLKYKGMTVWKSPNGKYFVIKFRQKFPYGPYKFYVDYKKP